jgi:hypothetical protein
LRVWLIFSTKPEVGRRVTDFVKSYLESLVQGTDALSGQNSCLGKRKESHFVENWEKARAEGSTREIKIARAVIYSRYESQISSSNSKAKTPNERALIQSVISRVSDTEWDIIRESAYGAVELANSVEDTKKTLNRLSPGNITYSHSSNTFPLGEDFSLGGDFKLDPNFTWTGWEDERTTSHQNSRAFPG